MLIAALSKSNQYSNTLNSFDCGKYNKCKVNDCSSDKICFKGKWGTLQVQEHLPEIKQQCINPLIEKVKRSFLGINIGINLKKLKDIFEGFGEIICSLMADNDFLMQKVENLKKEVQLLNQNNNGLKTENSCLKAQNNDLEAENCDLDAENSRLKAQIIELKNKFNNNSNSTNLENNGLKAVKRQAV